MLFPFSLHTWPLQPLGAQTKVPSFSVTLSMGGVAQLVREKPKTKNIAKIFMRSVSSKKGLFESLKLNGRCGMRGAST